MCTQVTMKDMVTAHHEVGHNMYHIAYKDQIQYFRDGANDGKIMTFLQKSSFHKFLEIS